MKGLMNKPTNFRYDKEMIFSEFNDAKAKDTKLAKGDDHKIYTNRIKLLKEYIELEKTMPEVFENVSIKFDKLLNLYLTPNPRDAFYKSFFGKTFAEKKAEEGYDDYTENNKELSF